MEEEASEIERERERERAVEGERGGGPDVASTVTPRSPPRLALSPCYV